MIKGPIIYLDHAASMRMCPGAIRVALRSMEDDFCNPSSAHLLGRNLKKGLEKIREDILNTYASSSFNCLFTSSATESNNLLIKGIGLAKSDHIVANAFSHKSILSPVENNFEKYTTYKLKQNFDLEEFVSLIKAETKLVILDHVCGQSGLLFPIEKISKRIKKTFPRIHIHVDGAQAFGKYEERIPGEVDSYTVSSHKIGGPKGLGLLFFNKNIKLEALLEGGGHEFGLRSSTLSPSLIKSFKEALDTKVSLEKISSFRKVVLESVNSSFVEFPFESNECSPYILLLVVKKIPSDVILRSLEDKGVYISSTSACSSKIKGFNQTFDGLGLPENIHKNILRVSFGKDSTMEEVHGFVSKFNNIIKELGFLF